MSPELLPYRINRSLSNDTRTDRTGPPALANEPMDTPGLLPSANGGPPRSGTDGPGSTAVPPEGLAPVVPLSRFGPGPNSPTRPDLDPELRELIQDLALELRQRCQDLNSLYFASRCRVDPALERRISRLLDRA